MSHSNCTVQYRAPTGPSTVLCSNCTASWGVPLRLVEAVEMEGLERLQQEVYECDFVLRRIVTLGCPREGCGRKLREPADASSTWVQGLCQGMTCSGLSCCFSFPNCSEEATSHMLAHVASLVDLMSF